MLLFVRVRMQHWRWILVLSHIILFRHEMLKCWVVALLFSLFSLTLSDIQLRQYIYGVLQTTAVVGCAATAACHQQDMPGCCLVFSLAVFLFFLRTPPLFLAFFNWKLKLATLAAYFVVGKKQNQNQILCIFIFINNFCSLLNLFLEWLWR